VSERCDLAIAAVVPVQDGFAAVLTSNTLRTVSGSLWVDTEDSAFRVPFLERAAAVPKDQRGIDPIAFRLPAGSAPIGMFIDTLDRPSATRCMIVKPWVPGVNRRFDSATLASIAPAVTSMIVAVPIADIHADCGGRSATPGMIRAAAPDTPAAAAVRGVGGTVAVKVSLVDDSSIQSTTIQKTASTLLNASSLAAANASLFQTEFVQCIPVAASYIYAVRYNTP
jgi:hypothetical protein